ncbi:MAG: hypothetical protein K0Q74_636 [Gammaproteobacteria bacterium]|nr:hypothetical protein [Gammaproteobacteria bacterium]
MPKYYASARADLITVNASEMPMPFAIYTGDYKSNTQNCSREYVFPEDTHIQFQLTSYYKYQKLVKQLQSTGLAQVKDVGCYQSMIRSKDYYDEHTINFNGPDEVVEAVLFLLNHDHYRLDAETRDFLVAYANKVAKKQNDDGKLEAKLKEGYEENLAKAEKEQEKLLALHRKMDTALEYESFGGAILPNIPDEKEDTLTRAQRIQGENVELHKIAKEKYSELVERHNSSAGGATAVAAAMAPQIAEQVVKKELPSELSEALSPYLSPEFHEASETLMQANYSIEGGNNTILVELENEISVLVDKIDKSQDVFKQFLSWAGSGSIGELLAWGDEQSPEVHSEDPNTVPPSAAVSDSKESIIQSSVQPEDARVDSSAAISLPIAPSIANDSEQRNIAEPSVQSEMVREAFRTVTPSGAIVAAQPADVYDSRESIVESSVLSEAARVDSNAINNGEEKTIINSSVQPEDAKEDSLAVKQPERIVLAQLPQRAPMQGSMFHHQTPGLLRTVPSAAPITALPPNPPALLSSEPQKAVTTATTGFDKFLNEFVGNMSEAEMMKQFYGVSELEGSPAFHSVSAQESAFSNEVGESSVSSVARLSDLPLHEAWKAIRRTARPDSANSQETVIIPSGPDRAFSAAGYSLVEASDVRGLLDRPSCRGDEHSSEPTRVLSRL